MIWWWPDQYHGGFDDIDSVVSGQDDTGGYIAFCHWLGGLFAAETLLTFPHLHLYNFRSSHQLHIGFGTQAHYFMMLAYILTNPGQYVFTILIG